MIPEGLSDEAVEFLAEIEITQWEEGRTLSKGDIAVLQQLLKDIDEDRESQATLWGKAEDSILRELGGEELCRAYREQRLEHTEIIVQNALQQFYQKRALELATRKKAAQ